MLNMDLDVLAAPDRVNYNEVGTVYNFCFIHIVPPVWTCVSVHYNGWIEALASSMRVISIFLAVPYVIAYERLSLAAF